MTGTDWSIDVAAMSELQDRLNEIIAKLADLTENYVLVEPGMCGNTPQDQPTWPGTDAPIMCDLKATHAGMHEADRPGALGGRAYWPQELDVRAIEDLELRVEWSTRFPDGRVIQPSTTEDGARHVAKLHPELEVVFRSVSRWRAAE